MYMPCQSYVGRRRMHFRYCRTMKLKDWRNGVGRQICRKPGTNGELDEDEDTEDAGGDLQWQAGGR